MACRGGGCKRYGESEGISSGRRGNEQVRTYSLEDRHGTLAAVRAGWRAAGFGVAGIIAVSSLKAPLLIPLDHAGTLLNKYVPGLFVASGVSPVWGMLYELCILCMKYVSGHRA